MGRPRLYHTLDEKREANRKKSKRHYDKEKKSVRMRQSVKYRKDNQLSPNDANYWSAKAEQVELKFSELMGKSTFDYVDALYRSYLANQNTKTFHDAVNTISELQHSIRQHQADILQLAGVGKDWEQWEAIGKRVSDVLKALEDLLCYAMSGVDDLVVCYSRQELLYQVLLLT